MSVTPNWLPLIIIGLMLALPLLVTGLLLLREGRSGRRGSEPHCRACEYSLVGIQSKRCPECGIELSEQNVIRGQRTGRPGLTWTGATMILLGVTALVPVGFSIFHGVDWYQYKPTYFVINDLRVGGTGIAYRAMRELIRRDGMGSLSLDSRRQIVEVALKEQSAAVPGPLASQLVDFAGAQYAAGAMTEAQKLKFLQQMIQLTLLIRPTVPRGAAVAYRVDELGRTPAKWSVRVNYEGVSIDGKQIQGASGSATMSGVGSGGSMGNSVKFDEPGEHQLEVVARVEAQEGSFGQTQEGKPPLAEDRKLTGKFQVATEPLADPIKLIDDPQLGSMIRAALAPAGFRIAPGGRGQLHGGIEIRRCPEGIAFDVLARVNGREISLGTIQSIKGGGTEYHVSSADAVDLAGSSAIDVILRSSPAVARNSVDLHEIWSGELIFENVPVTASK